MMVYIGQILGNNLIKPLSANPTKWSTHSNNLSAAADELFVCVCDHFVGLVLKGLIACYLNFIFNVFSLSNVISKSSRGFH